MYEAFYGLDERPFNLTPDPLSALGAIVADEPGPPEVLRLKQVPIPEPGPGQIRVKVDACGVCHSDKFVAEALWPGIELPRVALPGDAPLDHDGELGLPGRWPCRR